MLARAIEAVEQATRGNPDILMFGRDLVYSGRGLGPTEALDQSRFALVAALAARDFRIAWLQRRLWAGTRSLTRRSLRRPLEAGLRQRRDVGR
jgi:hypothetical protein